MLNERIHKNLPYIKSEIIYSIKYEYTINTIDFIARRTRFAFLDVYSTFEALPTIIEIMGNHLKWDSNKRNIELKNSIEFLNTMGLDFDNKCQFTFNDIKKFKNNFFDLDKNYNGFITLNTLKSHFINDLHLNENNIDFLNDYNQNQLFYFQDYLNFIQNIKNKQLI
jgi:hypothetical protein